MVAQGRKRVELGRTTFTYDESRYLLTSLDLPVVSRVIEASEDESLSLHRAQTRNGRGPRASRAGRRFASRRRRRTVLAWRPARPRSSCLTPAAVSWTCWRPRRTFPFSSGLIQREIIYRILRGPEGARLRAIATLGDQSHRTAKAIAWIRSNYAKPLTGGRSRKNRGHGRLHTAPPFPGADRDESSSVSKAASVAGSARTAAHGWSGRRQCGL